MGTLSIILDVIHIVLLAVLIVVLVMDLKRRH